VRATKQSQEIAVEQVKDTLAAWIKAELQK
jgi:hypothetical protein